MMSTTETSTTSQQMRYLDRGQVQSLTTIIDARTVRLIHVISDQYIWSVRSDRTGQQMTGGVTGYQTAVMAAIAALDQVAR
jgi:hypothetical protein